MKQIKITINHLGTKIRIKIAHDDEGEGLMVDDFTFLVLDLVEGALLLLLLCILLLILF